MQHRLDRAVIVHACYGWLTTTEIAEQTGIASSKTQ